MCCTSSQRDSENWLRVTIDQSISCVFSISTVHRTNDWKGQLLLYRNVFSKLFLGEMSCRHTQKKFRMGRFSNVLRHYGSKTVIWKAHDNFNYFRWLMSEWCLACVQMIVICCLDLCTDKWRVNKRKLRNVLTSDLNKKHTNSTKLNFIQPLHVLQSISV